MSGSGRRRRGLKSGRGRTIQGPDMSTTSAPPRSTVPPSGDGVGELPGIIDADTLAHLLDVELARARRYEHPFAVLRLTAPGGAAALRAAAGALRLHTRWADSVAAWGGGLLVILRDTPVDGARAAVVKLRASLAEELGEDAAQALVLAYSVWRKGDDRNRLLARLG